MLNTPPETPDAPHYQIANYAIPPHKTVYAAGPIGGLSYVGATGWRVQAEMTLAAYGITLYSPMRGKDYLESEAILRKDYNEHVMSTAKGITTRDRRDVQNAGMVLANLAGAMSVSVGTCIELGWADAFRVPVVLILGPEDTLHSHPMLREIAGYIVPDLPQAIDVIRRFFAY